MPAAQPGSNSRGRGGKFRKFTRGGAYQPTHLSPPRSDSSLIRFPPTGGKHFSRDLRPVDANGNEISMWASGAHGKKGGDDDDEEEEDEDSEEDSEEESGEEGKPVTREERKQAAKARKEAAIARKKAQAVEVGDMPPTDSEEESDDDMPANPNHSKASRNQTQAASVDEVTEGVQNLTAGNRKERESAEAALAKERYRQLHEQGKTDEAKADMARLRLIREQREAEAARRQVSSEPGPLPSPIRTETGTDVLSYNRPRRRRRPSRKQPRRLSSTPRKPRRGRPRWARRPPRSPNKRLSA